MQLRWGVALAGLAVFPAFGGTTAFAELAGPTNCAVSGPVQANCTRNFVSTDPKTGITTSFDAAAISSAAFGLLVGNADLSVINAFDSVTAAAAARYDDTFTVIGPGSEPDGYINFIFDISGTSGASQVDGITSGGGGTLLLNFGIVGDFNSSGTLTTGPIPIPFAAPLTTTFEMESRVAFVPDDPQFHGTFSGSGHADFTVRLAEVEILDANGSPLPGARVSSESGYTYPLSSTVPEPRAVWLAFTGLLCLAASRLRKRRSE